MLLIINNLQFSIGFIILVFVDKKLCKKKKDNKFEKKRICKFIINVVVVAASNKKHLFHLIQKSLHNPQLYISKNGSNTEKNKT